MSVCLVCGAAATVQVCDLQELEPTPPDAQGRRWRQWAKAGEARAYCVTHAQPGKVLYLPTTTPEDIDKMRRTLFW